MEGWISLKLKLKSWSNLNVRKRWNVWQWTLDCICDQSQTNHLPSQHLTSESCLFNDNKTWLSFRRTRWKFWNDKYISVSEKKLGYFPRVSLCSKLCGFFIHAHKVGRANLQWKLSTLGRVVTDNFTAGWSKLANSEIGHNEQTTRPPDDSQ